jgi:hypothetical protein
MFTYWGFVVTSVVMASVIFPEPMGDLQEGWRSHRGCRVLVKDNAECRQLAEGFFARTFPEVKYEWPNCGKDDLAEAILWAALKDKDGVGRYLGYLRRLCR